MGDCILNFTADNYRSLGKTGIKVSPIGLGTVKIGRNTGLKYPLSFQLPTEIELQYLIEQTINLGINFIDTAPAYGESETRLGNLLSKRRQDWVICTKVGEVFENNTSSYNFTAKHCITSIENSLKRLQTDYLDVVLVHCDNNDLEALAQSDVVNELKKFQSRGYIRAIGASTKTVNAGRFAVENMDVVMLGYNQADSSQSEVIAFAQQHGKGVLLKKIFASGHSHDMSAAVRFALAPRGIASAVVGTTNPLHLKENVYASLTDC